MAGSVSTQGAPPAPGATVHLSVLQCCAHTPYTIEAGVSSDDRTFTLFVAV